NSGAYDVSLLVSDSSGDAVIGHVRVDAGPVPTVAATASPVSGEAPVVVSFSGSVRGGSPPLLAWWDFGDGNLSFAAVDTHTYAYPGLFLAMFWVEDGSGTRFASAPIAIRVTGPGPQDVVELTASRVAVVLGGELTLSGQALGGNTI